MKKDALAHGLERRSSAGELQEAGILKPRIAGAAEALEKEMKKDALGHELTKRATQSELQEAGILKALYAFVIGYDVSH